MRVLLIDAPAAGADDAAGQLLAAGHDVLHCASDGTDHLCAGMPGASGCPVADGVDVAVSTAMPAVGNVPDGVRCAVRGFVPLVMASDAVAVDGAVPILGDVAPDVLVAAVAEVAMAPLPRHSELGSTELRAVLATHGIDDTDADVVVVRSGGDLRVELRPGVDLPDMVAQAAAVRVAAVLRAYDSQSQGVSVALGR